MMRDRSKVDQHPHKVKVVGSSPIPATRARTAQNKCRGERQHGSGEGEKVRHVVCLGSNPDRGRGTYAEP